MLCRRQDSLSLDLDFPFSPTSHLSLCVAYIVSLRTRIRINTPRVALPRGRQNRPTFPLRLCVRFRATAAPSCLVSSLFAFLRHARSPDLIPPIAIHHSHPRTHTFQSLIISSPSRLDRRPVTHACSSGNNKLRTPLPFTLTRVLPSGMSLGFYFYIAHFGTHARTSPPPSPGTDAAHISSFNMFWI